MIIWIDAQLPPSIAIWIKETFSSIDAKPLRNLGLRDANDLQIFEAAKQANVIVMTKDSDFLDLLEQFGQPPKIIWLTCGNTSNERLKQILSTTLIAAVHLLTAGEPLVEIGSDTF